MILLDTHAAIWLAIDQGLGKQSQRIADKALADDRLTLSAFSFWELGMLIAKRRLRAVKSAGELRSKLLGAGIRELPLTGEIAILAAELEGLDGDPADRIIAATAITHDATLMTADANLLQWRHGLKRHNAEQ
ncbi:MAG TPA: type II toxin-antitoxin system VapC family toxin [Xanthobacteraceae bacterium]|nr:type II toxin-antitoxin system VapC family toxin [Xanthobacteraceae bacterium]